MKRIRALVPATDNGRSLAIGLGLLAIGLFLAWPPLAFIVPGAVLTLMALFTTPPPEAES